MRDGALVAQQPQVPGGRAQRVAEPAEAEQSAVGVGRVGEPAEQHRQQGALDRRAPADAGGQGLEVAQRAGRVLVAERLQPRPGGLGREPGLVRCQPGHRRQQRPVEELLVQPAHLAGVLAPLAVQLRDRVGAQADRAGQPAQLVGVLGHDVGAPEPVQLQPVLDRAQEPVGAVQLGGVVAADVAVGRQRLERLEGVGAAQRLVGAAVHQLQQLDGELHVPQAAGPELELAVAVRGRQRLLDPAAHLLHVDHEVVALRRLPTPAAPSPRRRPGRARGRPRPGGP